jgi:ABC-2 type transport system permease protein
MRQSIATLTLVEREVSRIFRVWRQTIIPPLVTAALYILIFGFSLGNRIDLGDGASYLTFIFPGLVLMGVITSAYSNSSFSLFINKFHKSIQELLASPMSYVSINIGYTIGSLVRAFIVGVGTYLVGFLLAGIGIMHILLAIYIVIITSIIFSQAGILTAMWADDFDQVNVFTVFLITPLIYVGGVFYPIELLPAFWRTLSAFNPIFYLVDSFRYAFIGTSIAPVFLSVSLATIIAVGLSILNIYLFKKGYKIRS